MAVFIVATFYGAMVVTGWVVELVFGALGLVPSTRSAKVVEASISWNYTSALNIVFLVLAAVFLWRFFSTGGAKMLRMMGGDPPAHNDSAEHGKIMSGS